MILLRRLFPRTFQGRSRGGIDAGPPPFLLDEHVVESVGIVVVDVGINGGIPPVEKQTGLGEPGERPVGIRIIHPVVALFRAVEHGVVDEVAAFPTVWPCVGIIPEYLRGPHAADGGIVVVGIGRLGVAEDGRPFAEIERHRLPVEQILAPQQVDAIVVPFARLGHEHVRGHHEIAFGIVRTADIGIACATLNAGMPGVVEDGAALPKVLEVQAVTADGESRPLSGTAHVAVEVAVGTFLGIPGRGGESRRGHEKEE